MAPTGVVEVPAPSGPAPDTPAARPTPTPAPSPAAVTAIAGGWPATALFRPSGEVVASALVTDAALFADVRPGSRSDQPGRLVRLDRSSGRPTASVATGPLVELGPPVLAGGVVWLALRGGGSAEVRGYDPRTLAGVRSVSLPPPRSSGQGSAVIAGDADLLWVATGDLLRRIDPGSGDTLVELAAAGAGEGIALGGGILVTADSAGSTGLEACVRDPRSGTARGCTALEGVGAGDIATAGLATAWVAYRTGMLGTARRLVPPGATPAQTLGSYSMGVQLSVVDGVLWTWEATAEAHGVQLSCASPTTGTARASEPVPASFTGTVIGDPANLYVVSFDSGIQSLRPPRACFGGTTP